MSVEDVTARVNAAVKPGMAGEQAANARKGVIAAIEKESKDKTGLRSDVVTLYQGGAYHLYRYKRYDDVRLVFAPEQQIAFYAAIRTILSIRGMTSIFASFAFMKMASRQRSTIS